ncbi:MAG: outer membrane beta-barrel protein [Bacteroidia bacterium]|nr:outer membrane beta-barrel protein [Bacteroidia bacterium]
MYRSIAALLILMLIVCQAATAKKKRTKSKDSTTPFEVGLSLGGSSFITSFNPDAKGSDRFVNYWQNKINPGVGLTVTRNVYPWLGIGLNYLFTSFTGTWNDKSLTMPVPLNGDNQLSYKSMINQFDLLLNFNINKLVAPGKARDKWNIYIRTGPGYTMIKDNIVFFTGQLSKNTIRFSYTFDPGVSFRLSDNIKLKAGIALRIVFTDNLDGVHLFSTDPGWKYSYHISEIYHYTYLSINYNLGGKISSKPKIHSYRLLNRPFL